jgi:hypothetical protein
MFWGKKKEKPEIPDTYIVKDPKSITEKPLVTLVTECCPLCNNRHTCLYDKYSLSRIKEYSTGEYVTAVFTCPVTNNKYQGEIYV